MMSDPQVSPPCDDRSDSVGLGQLPSYPKQRSKKNYVLMLNSTEDRRGSACDEKNMKDLWKKITRKEPIVKEMSSAEETFQEIEKVSNLKKEDVNYVVVIISSHGGLVGGRVLDCEKKEGYWILAKNRRKKGVEKLTERWTEVIHCSNGDLVDVKDLLEKFKNSNAKGLVGVPKLFLFQFCRGKRLDLGVGVDAIGFGMQEPVMLPRSEVSDTLVAYSTQVGYVAWRNTSTGSWFIKNVKEIFSKYFEDEDVVDMLTRVNAEMNRKQTSGGEKAMSQFESSLTKKFFL